MAGKDVGENSKIFPRVTMCDFTIRQFSNLQDYTVECSLPINLFSEKFFIFIWFWIVVVFFANIYSLLSWMWSVFTISKVNYVKKYVKLVEKVNKSDYKRKHIACFAEEYLKHDGIFYLRMLAANANDVLVAQMIACLWKHYKSHHMHTKEYHKPHHNQPDDLEDGISVYEEEPEFHQSFAHKEPTFNSYSKIHPGLKSPTKLKLSKNTKPTTTLKTSTGTKRMK